MIRAAVLLLAYVPLTSADGSPPEPMRAASEGVNVGERVHKVELECICASEIYPHLAG
jgi:hypothetical protein